MSTKPRRRWLRFSLRSLLVLVLVIGVSLGYTIYKVREQGFVVAALKKMGCLVEYRIADGGSATILERLRRLLGEDEARSVIVLHCQESQVTDAGLVHLRGLPQLRRLNLSGTQVTDAGLAHLRGLTQLQQLDLIGTQITDVGLVHLRGLTALTQLNLLDAQVTDAGLVHLGELSELRSLDLNGTQVTDAGVQRLRKILPHCQIGFWP